MANPFFVTGKRLVQLAQEAEAGDDIAAVLVRGVKEDLEKRWAASAVLLNNGEWCVVPFKEPVAMRGNAQIRFADSGTLGGRVHWRDATWIEANVDKVYLGALKLPDGEGGRAQHAGGPAGAPAYACVTPAEQAPADRLWQAAYKCGEAEEEAMELGALLLKVGATATELAAVPQAAQEAQEERLFLTKVNKSAGRDASKYLQMLQLEVDTLGGSLDLEEVAGVLCAAADAPEETAKVATLLRKQRSGVAAREAAARGIVMGLADLHKSGTLDEIFAAAKEAVAATLETARARGWHWQGARWNCFLGSVIRGLKKT